MTRFRLAALSVALVCFIDLPANAAIQWQIADGGNGHFYELIFPSSNIISWHDAKAAAEASSFLGSNGHLATVTSASENDFLRMAFENLMAPDLRVFGGRRGDFAWIGLTDSASEGNYQWVTGEAFTYQNWGGPEPNNLFDEDYAFYWRRDFGSGPTWSWNDSDPALDAGIAPERLGYIVEYGGPFAAPAPEPSTLSIFGISLGLAVCTRFRRRKGRRS